MLSFLAISVELEGRKFCGEVLKTPCVLSICRGEAERLRGNGDRYHCPWSLTIGMTSWDSAHPGTMKTLPAAGYTAPVLHWQLVVIPLAVVILLWQPGDRFAHHRQADAELSFTDLEKFKKYEKVNRLETQELALWSTSQPLQPTVQSCWNSEDSSVLLLPAFTDATIYHGSYTTLKAGMN